MIECDPNVAVIAMLSSDEAVVAAVNNRIWSPRIPAGFNPEDGAGISLHIRGGKNGLYDPIVEPSFQVVTWAVSTKKARAVMAAVTRVLHNLADQQVATVDGTVRVLTGVQEVYPQDVIDSDTGWFTCVSFFRLKMVLEPNS
jgi:hypothetical protein